MGLSEVPKNKTILNRVNIMVVMLIGIMFLVSILVLGKDNVVEELIEKVIDEETGLKIDLTPID